MPRHVINLPAFTISSIMYLIAYSLFTGAVQYIPAQHLGLDNAYLVFTNVETQTYSGPLIQLIGDGYMLDFRVFSLIIGAVISVLVGINIAILWRLYRAGKLRACLVGGAGGGSGALIANLACSAYLCCGWAPSLIVLGTALTTSISIITTPISIALLAFNAVILTKRARASINSLQIS